MKSRKGIQRRFYQGLQQSNELIEIGTQ